MNSLPIINFFQMDVTNIPSAFSSGRKARCKPESMLRIVSLTDTTAALNTCNYIICEVISFQCKALVQF